MEKEIAVYSARITVRSDDALAKPLTISDFETVVGEAIADEHLRDQDAEVVVTVDASRVDS